MENDDGFIYGYVNSLSKKIFRDLKNGNIPVDDSFDLHGLTTQEAKKELQAFIVNSFNGGRSCLLIIHGKGNTSRHNIAIIKEHIPSWVTSKNLSRAVLAYATALPKDGGTGAIYLLLNN
ncbi:MAG: Smr/MutS family protein [Deltaproteobacteria bacterium]|nr:Smr/MutS family protein [Deltaproteobacteria bacterium]